MELKKVLKEKVEKAETKEAKEIIEKVGITLNDEKLEQVAGGRHDHHAKLICDD